MLLPMMKLGYNADMVAVHRYIQKPNAGLSLVEMMFSVAILSIALVSVIGGIVTSYEANAGNRLRTIATEEARALLDELRIARSGGLNVPEGFRAKYATDEQKLPHKLLKNATRKLTMRSIMPGILFLDVEVSWDDLRGRRSSVVLSSALTNHE